MPAQKIQLNVRIHSELVEQVRFHCGQPGAETPGDFVDAALRAHLDRVGSTTANDRESASMSHTDADREIAIGERIQGLMLRIAELDMHIKRQDARFEQVNILLSDFAEATKALAREVRLHSAKNGRA